MRMNIPLLLLTLVVMGGLLAAGIHMTEIDTDITRFLPKKERAFSDAGHILKHHPIQSEMVIDLGVEHPDRERLVQCARWVTQRLQDSGLFARVGVDSMQAVVPDLINHLVDHLPGLFTADELSRNILPMLTPEAIDRQLATIKQQLMGMDAIGQAALITRDPLGLRNVALAKLAHMAPSTQVEFYKGQLLSKDHRHLLLVATPSQAGTDTAFALQIQGLMAQLDKTVQQQYGGKNPVSLTPMGAYRAALDNEQIVRKDVQKAIALATLGIALLLMLTFPRPLVGLFAFLPAIGGTVAAFFVLALLHRSISIMALGFGGAIISITVDHGIAYLLFLDRGKTSYGKAASTEIWAIGLIAALTSMGAFGALCLTGFPVFQQLGQFAAMGIGFSFLFVHLVFPRIFPKLPPAKLRRLPLRQMVAKIPMSKKGAAFAAAGFALVMLFFARPEFNTQLSAMNTVRKETTAAEALITRVWGSALFGKIYLMTEAPTPVELQTTGDRLLDLVEQDLDNQQLASGFMPAMVFPGEARRKQNLEAWREFWTSRRMAQVQSALARAIELGFATDAFAPFMRSIQTEDFAASVTIPPKFHTLLGVAQQGNGTWMQFATLSAGSNYDAGQFHSRYSPMARIFDPIHFSQTMGRVLFSTFTGMLVIIGVSVTLLLFVFFLDWKLALISLTPVLFALVCTLGTLKLMGHQLDIPSLMLAIVVFGMGIDYALFFARAFQRYGGVQHPDFERIKMAVMMAAASTLIGFGVLCGAEHNLLRSAGLTSLLGIGYSLLGAFLLLPPMLKYGLRPSAIDPDADWRQRVLARYKGLETYPRVLARFKLRCDTLYDELPGLFNASGDLGTVLDIGCGHGVPGCYVLERYAKAALYGMDPSPERARVAARAFGERGHVTCGGAPDFPKTPGPIDAAFMLNVVHLLDDQVLQLTLQRLTKAMRPDAPLIVRALTSPQKGGDTWLGRIDAIRLKLAGTKTYFRSAAEIEDMLVAAGFQTEKKISSGGNESLFWFVAKPHTE